MQKWCKLTQNIVIVSKKGFSMIAAATKQKVEQKVAEVAAKITDLYGICVPFPVITYDLAGPCAGLAGIEHKKKTTMRLNHHFLHHYDWRFIDEIVPHEMCHLGTWLAYGLKVKPHGVEWYGMMDDIGVDVIEPYHEYDLRKTKIRYHTKHLYKCMSCHAHHFETASEHNYIKARHKYAHCTLCGRRLTYIQELGKISYNRCLQLYGRYSNDKR
jgi:SprT protein